MTCKIFVIGDLHLKNQDHLGVITKEGINSRLIDKIDSLNFCVSAAIKEKATHIIVLGDIFNGFTPDERVRKMFWKTMAPAVDAGIIVYIMRGNHDTYGDTANLDAELPILAKNVKILPNTLVIEDLEEIPGKIKHVEGATLGKLCNFKMAFIPYKDNAEIIKKYAEECKDCEFVFGHIEIEGAALGVDNHQMRSAVSAELFIGHALVWLGHIHKSQNIRLDDPKFAYIGSTTKCDFAEIDDKKIYGVIEINDDGKAFKTKFLEIPQRPMIQVDVLEEDVNNLYNAKTIPDTVNVSGALVKLILVGSSSWMKTVNRVKFKKRFTKALKVSFGEKKMDVVEQTVIGTTNSLMEDRVKIFNEARNKGPEYLKVGLELSALTRATT